MATAVRNAFEVISELPQGIATQEAQEREPRYLFYAGDEPGLPAPGGLQVSSPCIPNKMLWRCAVTPALTAPVRMRAVDIPEGRLIDGTQDGKGLAAMLLPCGPEVDELLANYGHSDPGQSQRRWGLVELIELRGKEPREVAKLQLTETFFPGWPSIPETNAKVEAQIRTVLETLRNATDETSRLKRAVGERMLTAVQQAQEYQSRLIRQGNIRVTYPDSNDGHKPGFDAKDDLFSLRSETPLAMNALRGNQSDAAAATIGAVVEKVLERFQPAQPTAIDPQQIATIVAATIQAMGKAEPAKSEEPAPKIPLKK